ncbi:MAG: phage tail tape measure protein [Jiangellaceae bacterium]
MAVRTVAVNLIANVAPYIGGMRQAQAATAATAASAGRLQAGTAAAGTAMAGASTQAGRLTGGVKQAGQSMAGVAAQAGLMRGGLLNPITAVGAAAVGATKAAIDWESAWTGVEKTVDGSASQMERLEGDLRDMTGELPASHAEIAGVAEAAGQLGIKVDDVSEFTRTMIDLGESTNLSAEQAAVSLARFSNIMGTAREDTRRLGSTLVELGNNSATTESEILELSTRMAAAGEIIGLTEADVMALAAAVTSVGVPAEAAGTALSKTFTTMHDAVLDGQEELEIFAEVAGTTAEEFAARFREDPADAIVMFIEGLGRMNEAGQSTSQIFEDLSLNDERLKRALLSTAEAGDLLTEALGLASDEWEENTALAEEAANRYDDVAASMETSWNRIKDVAIDAGDRMAPVIAGIARGTADLLEIGTADLGSRSGWQQIGDVMRSWGVPEGLLISDEPEEQAKRAVRRTKELGDEAEGAERKVRGLGDASEDADPKVVGLGEAAEFAAGTHEDAAEHLQSYIDAIVAVHDPTLQMQAAEQNLAEAQQHLNELQDDGVTSGSEYEQALWDVFAAQTGLDQAALDFSREGGAETIATLKELAEKGILADEDVEFLIGRIEEFEEKGDSAAKDYEADLDLEGFDNAMSELDGVERRAIEATRQRTLRVNARVFGVHSAERALQHLARARTATIYSQAVTVRGGAQVTHSGGEVMPSGKIRKFHAGGMAGDVGSVPSLRSDEVPAILQTGEVVFSREQRSLLERALSPVMGRAIPGPSFHSGGAVGGGGAVEFRHTFEARGGSANALVDQLNYHLRQGDLNIRTEAVQQ